MPQPELSLHFVLRKGETSDTCAQDLRDAFKACEELQLQPVWQTEEQCRGQKSSRKDVFVLDVFEGELFSSLKTPLCVIVGARCLLTCLRRNISIPDTSLPVYTAAMHGLSVTTTQLDSDLKAEVRQLVANMGGVFCNSLRGCVTHVVVGNVISVKCEDSKKKKVRLMSVEWVRAVWEASLSRDVLATDEEFERYRCPLFHGVVATCTKLRTAEKKELAALICDHGGVFTGHLDATTTNLLVVGDPTGDKYQCAQQSDISCLSMQWVRDCVAAQDIMPFEDYVVHKGKRCSTPELGQSKFLPDFSTLSSIEGRPARSHVDETLSATVCPGPEPPCAPLRNLAEAEQVEQVIQQLVASKNCSRAPYLDGCKVLLSGFSTRQLDELRRVLNWAGATRYDELSETLTHVIVGSASGTDARLVTTLAHRPHVVNVLWLAESARLKCPAPEQQFLCHHGAAPSEPPSPLVKKGVAALQRSVDRKVPVFPLLEPARPGSAGPPESRPEELVQQYLHSQPGEEAGGSGPSGPADTSDSLPCADAEDSSSRAEFTEQTFFQGLVFEVLGYEEEQDVEDLIAETVLAAGGRLARNSQPVDYAITPCVVNRGFSCRARHAVSCLWLEECSEQKCVLPEPVDYFYRAVQVSPASRPLAGCVLTPSAYCGRERTFLVHLMQALGARVQHVFSRVAVVDKDLLPASHLITQDTSSQKFRAAVKWHLPVVTHEWLLACAAEDRRVPEDAFLVSPDASSGSTSHKAADSVTPSRAADDTGDERPGPAGGACTPVARRGSLAAGLQPAVFTPVDSRRLGLLLTQETPLRHDGAGHSPDTPQHPHHISTPETPYGQFLGPDPSPETRKKWKRWLDNVPVLFEHEQQPKRRRDSTPLSELKRRLWESVLPGKQGTGAERPGAETTPPDVPHCPERPGAETPPPDAPHCPERSGAETPHCRNRDSGMLGHPETLQEPVDAMTQSDGPSTPDAGTVAGPGVHTQIVRLNEALSARKQEGAGAKRRRCLDADRSDASAEEPAPCDHSSEYKALMGVEVPTEIAVTWEYRQNSEQSEPQTQSQGAVSIPRVFSLSGMDAQRAHYELLVGALGGAVSQSSSYDPACTHLVCERLARSERMLGSIAAGKWVLHPSYLSDSQRAGRFLPEEDYEWGGPVCPAGRELTPGSMAHSLASAAHRWRSRVARDGRAAFSDLRVLVHVGKERQEQFKRCVQAGGGQVVLLSDWCSANVCIVDVNKVSLEKPISLAVFVRNNIPLVPTLYLHEFLVRDPPPGPAEFAIPEYKELSRQRQASAQS
ncbi:DNA topoisomerase 2-binding protein 1-A isoform X2 [Bacillus rossius redtenbacheri]|uniref:DNA topoisomerase 2-binding protein 1-A isoform X2 n=1 Tax=Bacillus rossius redtenbacheri TaxID=93214 RepID=UPI002FDD3C7C